MTGAGAMRPMLIVADDLTGACDTAGAVTSWAGSVPVHLGVVAQGSSASCSTSPLVRALDLDSRAGTATRAAALTTQAMESASELDAGVYLKIDSTLRGHVLATVVAAAERFRAANPGGRVVVCPAFPARGRLVRNGRVEADGTALDATALLDLAALDGIEVHDALDDADLAAIAESAGGAAPVLWVGSAGLAAHVVRASLTEAAPHGGGAAVSRPRVGSVLVVVGSDQSASVAGAAALTERSDDRVRVVVGDPRRAGVIHQAARAWASADALVVTGGFTARRLFERAGVDALVVHGEVEPGVPWATLPGRPGVVVTKAGGFGGSGALGRAVDFLLDPA